MNSFMYMWNNGKWAAQMRCGHCIYWYVMLMATGRDYFSEMRFAVTVWFVKNPRHMVSKREIVWRSHFWDPFVAVPAPLRLTLRLNAWYAVGASKIKSSVRICISRAQNTPYWRMQLAVVQAAQAYDRCDKSHRLFWAVLNVSNGNIYQVSN